jgi:hypothetical protein
MSWTVPQIWSGGDVWIIGGGPSVTKEFGIPKDVVDKVISGDSSPSVYSPYMSYLHDKHVIGVNVAYLIGDWIDIVFFGDANFFLTHKHRLAQFPGLRVTCSSHTSTPKPLDWVKVLPRNGKKKRGLTDARNKVSWNYNSGAAAINLAVHTGAKRIILLGFDMTLDNNRNQHWHDLYGKKKVNANRNHKGTKKSKPLPFDRHKRGFLGIASDAKNMGVEIINIGLDSTIEQFEKMSLTDFKAREGSI